MKTIYKYQLPIEREVTLYVPGVNAQVIHVGDQMGKLTIWMEVDTDGPEHPIRFVIVGTGKLRPNANNCIHVGSAIVGDYVWHVYQMDI